MSTNTDPVIIEDLLTRGVENIISNKQDLKKRLESGEKLNVYLGIDPTATRIHVGHAFPLRKLQLMAEMGHNVTFLIGSFTALVGDTSDKNDERPVLTEAQIEENFQTYKKQASKILDFDKITVRHNSEWLSKLNFADLIQLAGNFSVNDFISRELIRDRLKDGKRVGLPETLYPLMQGYDSYHMDTDIQFGGTDQTFNMQAGRSLIKKLRSKDSFIIANGFLPGTDGRKMSKSWGNAIWLEDEPADMFGKIMSVRDDLLIDYFTYATNLSLKEIKAFESRLSANDANPMEIKKELARLIITELHDEASVAAAEQHFVDTVQNKEAGEDALVVKVESDSLSAADISQLLIDNKLVASKSEARRLFEQGGIRNGDTQLSLDDSLDTADPVTLRIGKRRYIKIEKA